MEPRFRQATTTRSQPDTSGVGTNENCGDRSGSLPRERASVFARRSSPPNPPPRITTRCRGAMRCPSFPGNHVLLRIISFCVRSHSYLLDSRHGRVSVLKFRGAVMAIALLFPMLSARANPNRDSAR